MQAAASEGEETQEKGNTTMDYDELTLNPMLADIEAESMTATAESEKNKTRHYWTPKQEECFYEIWGRDNWHLTRHGKNTVFFARWAEELKERFAIDVRPEEVQAKVNQTRAKFRQVKKQAALEKTTVRWKKFDIIDKILRNQYRPKDADPLPPEVMEKNRDYSPTQLNASNTGQSTPTSIASNSNTAEDAQQNCQALTATDQQLNVEPNVASVTITDHSLSGAMYNSNGDGSVNYTNELFSDDIKQEYEEDNIKLDDYQSEYQRYQYQQDAQNQYMGPPSIEEAEPQLHQLQTPQQQQQQQQQQEQQQYQPYATTGVANGAGIVVVPQSQPLAEQHMPQTLTQLQTPQSSNTYDHSSNSYAVTNQNANQSVLGNNQNHYGNSSSNNIATAPPATVTQQPNSIGVALSPQPYINHNNTASHMQPPRPSPQPRKRRATSSSTNSNFNAVPHQTADNSIDMLYIEEVRKKNVILEEHKQISDKRLQLEQRKISLMESFFPKCLELQEQILQKLNNV